MLKYGSEAADRMTVLRRKTVLRAKSSVRITSLITEASRPAIPRTMQMQEQMPVVAVMVNVK